MAANGCEDPPILQRVMWASLEGIAAATLVMTADNDNPKAALAALQSVPIVLGLPFTFLLFWMCHALLILCREESGEVPINRRNFKIFVINFETASFVAMLAPFLPLGDVAFRAWGGSRGTWQMRFAIPWIMFITFLFLGISDWSFAINGCAMLPIYALIVAGVRIGCRTKCGIDGDVVSDVLVGFFAMPFAIGQMTVEDMEEGDNQSKHNVVAPISTKEAPVKGADEPTKEEMA
jgi:hypothetical protein